MHSSAIYTYPIQSCARCAIAAARRGKEPLHTPAICRIVDGKAMFGQNAIHRAAGQLCQGDGVEVLEIH